VYGAATRSIRPPVGRIQPHGRELIMEILLAIIAVVVAALVYRNWRARSAH
jgi:hypothetical protein